MNIKLVTDSVRRLEEIQDELIALGAEAQRVTRMAKRELHPAVQEDIDNIRCDRRFDSTFRMLGDIIFAFRDEIGPFECPGCGRLQAIEMFSEDHEECSDCR